MARHFASSLQTRTIEKISKLAIVCVFLMAGLASAQTKQITIDSLEYAGTAVSIFDGVTVESAYNVNLDASKVTVDLIEFKMR